MTILFEEYETENKLKNDAKDLIGKLFYWCKNSLGEEFEFKPSNLLVVTGVQRPNKKIELTYQYVNFGNVYGNEDLDIFLKYAKPYGDGSLTVH